MKETKKIRWEFIFFWVCTILVLYINCVNIYPWYIGDYGDGEIKYGTFLTIIQWFVLYNHIIDNVTIEEAHQEEWKLDIYVFPFIFIATNIMPVLIFIYHDASTWSRLLGYLVIMGGLFFIANQKHIRIWYPISLYCTICAVPGGEYEEGLSGVGFIAVFLGLAIIFSIIEYIVMLRINLSVLKKGRLQENKKRHLWFSTFVLICILFPSTYARIFEYENYYVILALFVIICWFWRFFVSCSDMSDKKASYDIQKKGLIYSIPFLCLLINGFMVFLLYYARKMEWAEECTQFNFAFVILFLITVVLLYFSRKNHIRVWYPMSLFCGIYVVNRGVYEDTKLAYWLFWVIFMVIEYIIMLVLNRKLWHVPKSSERYKL